MPLPLFRGGGIDEPQQGRATGGSRRRSEGLQAVAGTLFSDTSLSGTSLLVLLPLLARWCAQADGPQGGGVVFSPWRATRRASDSRLFRTTGPCGCGNGGGGRGGEGGRGGLKGGVIQEGGERY